MSYLIACYVLVFGVLFFYGLRLARRARRLRSELGDE